MYGLARIVAAVAAVGGASQLPRAIAQFRPGIDLVNIGVTVIDRRGKLVSHLRGEDFELFEDGRKQAITFFESESSPAAEMHLGLLMDVSESMQDDIAFTRTAAIKFLNALTEVQDVTIVDFDTEVRVARFHRSEVARLVERIRSQKVRGDTALFDAIGVYLDGAAAQDGRKIMLLYTDGVDTRSVLRLSELVDLIKASDVTVYPIGALANRPSSMRADQQMVLRQIAETSGGQAFFPPSVKELDRVYEQVLGEI